MLQIQLGRYRETDPAEDYLGRQQIGSWPGMTQAEAWECGRGVWKFNADRALAQDEVQVVDLAGIVLAVAHITGITKCRDRFAIEGDLLTGDPRVGNPTTTPHPSRNSVAYFADQSARGRSS